MDCDHFDDVTRAISPLLSRRGLAGLLGLAALGSVDLAEARKRRKKRRNKKKKNKAPQGQVTLNAFGCVNVGGFCESAAQCCSGICTGSRCQAHDIDICRTGQTSVFCADGATDISCTGGGGGGGLCATTTGNAAFCATDRKCFTCKKDADCQPASVCGAGAACVICTNCDDAGGTACMAASAAGCA